ncbi:MAG: hypothetical protein LBC35_03825 [Coriobacteriales bacterium]|jgi:nucleoside-triphosphatase THEP1|nr:hypothetical protein [Coriobacteriales bacterium]
MLFCLTGGIQTGKTRWLLHLADELQACGVRCAGVISPGIWREIPDNDCGSRAARYEKLGIEVMLLPGGERLPFAQQRTALPDDKDAASIKQAGQAGQVGQLRKTGQIRQLRQARTSTKQAGQAGQTDQSKLSTGQTAQTGQTKPSTRQADQARLGWAIRDDTIAAVNRHFKELTSKKKPQGRELLPAEKLLPTEKWLQDQEYSQKHDRLPNQEFLPSRGLLMVDELGRLELELGRGFTAAVRLLDRGPSLSWPHALIVVRDSLADKAIVRFSRAWGSISTINANTESADAVLKAVSTCTTLGLKNGHGQAVCDESHWLSSQADHSKAPLRSRTRTLQRLS